MLLAGDIGGTKTHLALYSPAGGAVPQAEATYPSAEYDSLEAIATRFVAENKARVDRATFGVAGPVSGGQAAITNLPWLITEARLRAALDVGEVTLLNDLEATAYGIAHLAPPDLASLNGMAPRDGTRGVIAAGTGLGEAVLFQREGRYQVIASEGGHVDFAPTNLVQIGLLQALLARFGHVSYERVCSGIGIPNVYGYFRENRYAEELPEVAEVLRQGRDATPAIVQNALAGRCEICMATLNTFVSILGAEAGNLALKVYAEGGVYIGGGIPPRILPKLQDGTFMAAYLHKGRFADQLARFPVNVILKRDTALLGAACYGLGL